MTGQLDEEHVLVLTFRHRERLDPGQIERMLFEDRHRVGESTRLVADLKKDRGLVVSRGSWPFTA